MSIYAQSLNWATEKSPENSFCTKLVQKVRREERSSKLTGNCNVKCKIQKNLCTVTVAPTIENHGGHSRTPASQRWDQVPGRSQRLLTKGQISRQTDRHHGAFPNDTIVRDVLYTLYEHPFPESAPTSSRIQNLNRWSNLTLIGFLCFPYCVVYGLYREILSIISPRN